MVHRFPRVKLTSPKSDTLTKLNLKLTGPVLFNLLMTKAASQAGTWGSHKEEASKNRFLGRRGIVVAKPRGSHQEALGQEGSKREGDLLFPPSKPEANGEQLEISNT